MRLAEACGMFGKGLANIFVSIALTYSDCGDHKKALEFYEKELDVRKGELKEVGFSVKIYVKFIEIKILSFDLLIICLFEMCRVHMFIVSREKRFTILKEATSDNQN